MKFFKTTPSIKNKEDAITKVKQTFAKLKFEQQVNVFNLMWTGGAIQHIPLLNKLSDKMPGKQYQKIYSLINQLILFYEFKDVDYKTLNEAEKLLLNAYKHDSWTQRTRHLTPQMIQEYPLFTERLKKIFNNLRNKNFVDMDLFYIENDLLLDLQKCEEWEKNRFLEEFGIIQTEKPVNIIV